MHRTILIDLKRSLDLHPTHTQNPGFPVSKIRSKPSIQKEEIIFDWLDQGFCTKNGMFQSISENYTPILRVVQDSRFLCNYGYVITLDPQKIEHGNPHSDLE
jgi:hypothetical protein